MFDFLFFLLFKYMSEFNLKSLLISSVHLLHKIIGCVFVLVSVIANQSDQVVIIMHTVSLSMQELSL